MSPYNRPWRPRRGVVVVYSFFNLGTRWGGLSTTHPDRVTHCQEIRNNFWGWNRYNFLSIYSPFFWKFPVFKEAQLKASAVERNVRSPRNVPFRHIAGSEVYLHLFLTSALERCLVNVSPVCFIPRKDIRYPLYWLGPRAGLWWSTNVFPHVATALSWTRKEY
jgi:hypothetical protein